MKVLVWQFPDGSVALRELWESMRLSGESDDAFAERIRAKTQTPRMTPKDGAEALDTAAYEARMATMPNGGYGVFAGVVEKDSIPTDRAFRNAWKFAGGKVEHDMAKCREIHKQKLREIRAPKLSALDVEYMQADESGDAVKKAQIAAKKKALRDVTKDPAISLAQTPEELKSVIPAALAG